MTAWEDRVRSALVPYVDAWDVDACLEAIERALPVQPAAPVRPQLPDAGLLAFRLDAAERKLQKIRGLADADLLVAPAELRKILGPDA